MTIEHRTLQSRGFTLIELMIVLVIVAILAAIAYPSFVGQVRKSRRAEAVSTMSQIQQAQERWRANCASYAASITLTNPVATACTAVNGLNIPVVTGARYTYALSGVAAGGYTLTATAVAGTSQAADTACTALTVVVANGLGTNTPSACWSN